MDVKKSIQEALKSNKQKLYEKHILDEKGRLMLYHPVTQKLLFAILEEGNKLETELKKFDVEYEKELEKQDCR